MKMRIAPVWDLSRWISRYLKCLLGTEWCGSAKRALFTILSHCFYAIGLMLLSGVAFGIRNWRILQLVLSAPVGLFCIYYWWELFSDSQIFGLHVHGFLMLVNGHMTYIHTYICHFSLLLLFHFYLIFLWDVFFSNNCLRIWQDSPWICPMASDSGQARQGQERDIESCPNQWQKGARRSARQGDLFLFAKLYLV